MSFLFPGAFCFRQLCYGEPRCSFCYWRRGACCGAGSHINDTTRRRSNGADLSQVCSKDGGRRWAAFNSDYRDLRSGGCPILRRNQHHQRQPPFASFRRRSLPGRCSRSSVRLSARPTASPKRGLLGRKRTESNERQIARSATSRLRIDPYAHDLETTVS